MLDLLLTGGTVVDGTGAPRRRADVGVKDGRIVAIGQLTDEAATTVDATGKVITPGFIDVHTHFDAQVFWESALTPSPLHGVTTVIGGNCGFTIAPLSNDPSDGEYLMRMLARVEGMPLESLRDGVPWSWTSTAEYLDAVEKTSLGVNAGFMVGHSAIRRDRDGHRGDRTASRSRTSSLPWSACCTRAWRQAASASPPRGRARTTTPTGGWCPRVTPPGTRSWRCAR